MNNAETEAERKKDTLNLRPALEFVFRNLDKYAANYLELISKKQFISNNLLEIVNLNPAKYLNIEQLNDQPQVSQSDIQKIIPYIPETFQKLSLLEIIDYRYNLTVPLPLFEIDGSWHTVEYVQARDFPRGIDHPSRILIGCSNGSVIYPSALPKCIHEDDRARWFYQLHVFIHEFFHTIEYLRRSQDLREKVILEDRYGKEFTLQTWWEGWEKEFLENKRTPFVTRYASTYADDLNQDAFIKRHNKFVTAIAEQICESFVGYILGIVPNDEDNPVFANHSPWAWERMNYLATARILLQ